jgi:hypothetical protein
MILYSTQTVDVWFYHERTHLEDTQKASPDMQWSIRSAFSFVLLTVWKRV